MVQEQVRGRVALELASCEVSEGIFQHSATIQSSATGQLAKAKRIDIELTTVSQDCEVLEANLTFADPLPGGKTISFHAEKQHMPLGGFLSLEKNPGVFDSLPEDQTAELQITTRGSPKLSIWVQASKEHPISPLLWVRLSNRGNGQNVASLSGLIAYGRDGVAKITRAQLLAHTWGFGVAGSKLVYGICGCATLAWLAAVVVLAWPEILAAGAFRPVVTAVAAGLMCVSTYAVFSVITPPFHGPDEPSHFLGFAAIDNSKQLASSALALANAGHFERIKRRPDEKFTSVDVKAPQRDPWAYYIEPTYVARSPLGAVIWQGVCHVTSPLRAGMSMLFLRISNIVFVSIALAIALYACGRLLPREAIFPWLTAPALMVPSLAFYTVVVSNYPYLIGGYLIQAVALGVLFSTLGTKEDARRTRVTAGLLIGAGLGVTICSSDNSMAVFPFWAMIIPAYFFAAGLSGNMPGKGTAPLNELITPLSAAVLSICLLVAAVFPQGLFLPMQFLGALARTPLIHAGPFWSGILLLVACAACLWLVSLAMLTLGRRLQDAAWPWYLRILCVVATLLILALLLATAPAAIPGLSGPAGPRPPLADYIFRVVHAFADGFVPGKPDKEVTVCFWSMLGWLDCKLPSFLMHALRIMTGAGVLLLLFGSFRRDRFPAQAVFAVAGAVAVLACVAAIAVLYHAAGYNVNSRYILVAYIFSVALAAEGYRRACQCLVRAPIGRAAIYSGFCVLVIGVQSVAWVAVINRYF